MLDRQTAQSIHRCAAKLVGQAGITQLDIESIRQSLMAHVLDKLAGYDTKLGYKNGFVSAVVQRRLINLLRSRQVEKRDHRRLTSLNVKVTFEGETPTELANTVSNRELDARHERAARRLGLRGHRISQAYPMEAAARAAAPVVRAEPAVAVGRTVSWLTRGNGRTSLTAATTDRGA